MLQTRLCQGIYNCWCFDRMDLFLLLWMYAFDCIDVDDIVIMINSTMTDNNNDSDETDFISVPMSFISTIAALWMRYCLFGSKTDVSVQLLVILHLLQLQWLLNVLFNHLQLSSSKCSKASLTVCCMCCCEWACNCC